jgi:hypothetical protein
MHKNRLEGAAAEGDGKKKLAASNSRAGLETTSAVFAVKARNNNAAKAASMVVLEEGKAAAGAVGLATTRTTTAGSNGGKAGEAYEEFVLQVLEVLIFMTNRLPGRLCIIRSNVPICEVRVWRIFLVFL